MLEAIEDPEFAEGLIRQVFELWLTPEIERRRSAGAMPDDFDLRGAQVIFEADASAPQVRLNKEVAVVATFNSTGPIERGDIVSEADVGELVELNLTDVDAAAAHITLVRLRGTWVVAFDFRYNAALMAEHIESAEQFLELAAIANEKGWMPATVENLWAATELIAKAFLLSQPIEKYRTSKKHGVVRAGFNLFGKQGVVDPRFPALLNRLESLRPSARYLSKDRVLDADDIAECLALARELLDASRAYVPPRKSIPPDLALGPDNGGVDR